MSPGSSPLPSGVGEAEQGEGGEKKTGGFQYTCRTGWCEQPTKRRHVAQVKCTAAVDVAVRVRIDVVQMGVVGGLLDVILLDGFQPSEGDVFDILDASAIGRAGFDSLSLPGLADGLAWDTSSLMSGGSLSVSAIPEPASISLLLAALGALALVGHRRKGR